MNSTTFYPDAPIFGKSDIDKVPEEHRQRCILVSWPMGAPERVFTESEVRAMFAVLRKEEFFEDGGAVLMHDHDFDARVASFFSDPA
ncbi:MAG: hypothetical protein KDA21_08975 [Phycisphaerales bacterium]|nr:hypothetical protein [Phycisphaerales bacterium]